MEYVIAGSCVLAFIVFGVLAASYQLSKAWVETVIGPGSWK